MRKSLSHRNQNKFLKFAYGLLLTLALFAMPVLFHAQDSSFIVNAVTEQDLRNQIKELEKKIEAAKTQAQSLSREIGLLNNNIELKNIQIKQAEYQIIQKTEELDLLKEDIRLLEVRLDRLDETIQYHNQLLAERIRRSYIEGQRSEFEILISSEGFGDFMSKMEYLRRIEAEDRELINSMNETKGNYEDQQDLLVEKKQQVEEIKAEIETQKKQAEQLKVSLEQQKQQKDNLLRVTRNDEKEYQNRLELAKKELSQIQSAANVVVREGKAVKVKKGEVVGTMGNSGFSTGAHLHFGVYKYSVKDFESHEAWDWYYSNYANPLDYLKSKTITWGTGCYRDPKGQAKSGKGDWDWPMSDPRITQSYGSATCYNWMYGGKPHPALDMVGIGNISVRAVSDGEAYFCRNCLKDGGNGVFIFHDGGKMTLYWHLK